MQALIRWAALRTRVKEARSSSRLGRGSGVGGAFGLIGDDGPSIPNGWHDLTTTHNPLGTPHRAEHWAGTLHQWGLHQEPWQAHSQGDRSAALLCPARSLTAVPQRANAATSLSCMTLWRWYLDDAIRKRLAPDLQHMAAELRQLIEAEHAVVRQRHLARQQCGPTPLFVKNAPCLTIYEHERASLLPRELGDVFYKTATVQACSGDVVMQRA
jgi:hypothetical protein